MLGAYLLVYGILITIAGLARVGTAGALRVYRAYDTLERALKVSGYIGAGMMLVLICSIIFNRPNLVLFFTYGLVILTAVLFKLVNSTAHIITGSRFGRWAGIAISPAYALANITMALAIMGAVFVTFPSLFVGTGGWVLSVIGLAVVGEWITGQLTITDPTRPARIMRVTLWCLAMWLLLGHVVRELTPVEASRYGRSVWNSKMRDLDRKSLSNELSANFTEVTLTGSSVVYSGTYDPKDANLVINLRPSSTDGKALDKDKDGKYTNLLRVEQGGKLKARKAEAPLRNSMDEGEPLVEVQVPNEFGDYINTSGTVAGPRYFVPARVISTNSEDTSAKSSAASSTATGSLVSSTSEVEIPYLSFTDSRWSEQAGADPVIGQYPAHFWARKTGYVSYSFTAPKAGSASLTVRLSSELTKATSTDPAMGSTVTLLLNGNAVGTQEVIPDNVSGQDYVWNLPAVNAGQNSVTFKVDGGKENGLAIYSPIRITFQ